jgi:hypothetical protein
MNGPAQGAGHCKPLNEAECSPALISIEIRFERTVHGYTEVLGLFLRQPGKLCPQSLKVKRGNLLDRV